MLTSVYGQLNNHPFVIKASYININLHTHIRPTHMKNDKTQEWPGFRLLSQKTICQFNAEKNDTM